MRLVGVTVLAILGFGVAGCGSKKHQLHLGVVQPASTTVLGPTSAPITVTGSTATIANLRTGTRIVCKGWKGPGVKVPPRGAGANVGESEVTVDATAPSSSRQMQLDHLLDGSVTVSCKSG